MKNERKIKHEEKLEKKKQQQNQKPNKTYVKEFIDNYCQPSIDKWTYADIIHNKYIEWLNLHYPDSSIMSRETFGKLLAENNFIRERKATKSAWKLILKA